jgi:hypothetical protein
MRAGKQGKAYIPFANVDCGVQRPKTNGCRNGIQRLLQMSRASSQMLKNVDCLVRLLVVMSIMTDGADESRQSPDSRADTEQRPTSSILFRNYPFGNTSGGCKFGRTRLEAAPPPPTRYTGFCRRHPLGGGGWITLPVLGRVDNTPPVQP